MVDFDRLHTGWRSRWRGLKPPRPLSSRDAAASFSLEPNQSPTDVPSPTYADRIRALAQQASLDNLAAQSVVVAALRTLEQSLQLERQVAEAAISMAQQTRLRQMTTELEEAVMVLRALVTDQGAALLNLPTPREAQPDEADSWWFALTEAMQDLGKGATRLASMAAGQPKGGSVRLLSSIVARLLRNHHNQLLREAEQWMT